MGVAFGEGLAPSAKGWHLRQRIGALGAVLAPSLQGGCLIQCLRMFKISHQQSKHWKVDLPGSRKGFMSVDGSAQCRGCQCTTLIPQLLLVAMKSANFLAISAARCSATLLVRRRAGVFGKLGAFAAGCLI